MQINNESMQLINNIYAKNEVYYISLLGKSEQTVNLDESSVIAI